MKRILVLLTMLLTVQLAMAQDASTPDQLVKGITNDVISAIKQDRELQSGNSKRIADLVETKVLPHFNFGRMTQIAMAVNWRRANPDQQKQLVNEFRTLLVRTYSNALSLYRDQSIDFKPLRARAEDTEVTVRSEIKQRSQQAVTLDYDLEKTPAGWKVYDVKVGGVSLISTYRDEFATQVRNDGIDGLIKSLSTKNQQLANKGGKAT